MQDFLRAAEDFCTYMRTDLVEDAAEETSEVSCSFLSRPAAPQVVPGSQQADGVGFPGQDGVLHLQPQLLCRGPRSGHHPEGVRPGWQVHPPVSHTAQVGVPQQKHQLGQNQFSIRTITQYISSGLINILTHTPALSRSLTFLPGDSGGTTSL